MGKREADPQEVKERKGEIEEKRKKNHGQGAERTRAIRHEQRRSTYQYEEEARRLRR